MKFPIIIVCFIYIPVLISGRARISSDILSDLQTNPLKRDNVIVSFTKDTSSIIDTLGHQNFTNRAQKINTLVSSLKTFSQNEQSPVQSALRNMGVNFQTFWVNNKMFVPNANFQTIQTISQIANVQAIEKEQIFTMFNRNVTSRRQSGSINRWGIERIRADQVWQYYTGRGIVVAGIDSGVRYQHESLINNWRQRYGWYDPISGSPTPWDDNGHGTHTMGTIAGQSGLGVAPGVRWIACKGCSNDGCPQSATYSCGQWVLKPFESNGQEGSAEMAPHIVSNSWGANVGGNNYYDNVISAWRFAGIIPVCALGNSGPNCNTARSPGDRPNVIAVGNINQNSQIYRGFVENGQLKGGSSLGPAVNGNRQKPDIVAPGTEIWSASNQANNLYTWMTGTSQACPHVSGVIALMLERNPNLTYDQIYGIITGTVQRNVDTSTAPTCGGVPPNRAPNFVFGYGLIDALSAVAQVPMS